jgi:hypothetical protein
MEPLPKPIEDLVDAMDKAKVKITFGLTPRHIEAIEREFKRWEDMPPLKSGLPKADMRFSRYVWENLGKELGWCPFTLSLYYWEFLFNQVTEKKDEACNSF